MDQSAQREGRRACGRSVRAGPGPAPPQTPVLGCPEYEPLLGLRQTRLAKLFLQRMGNGGFGSFCITTEFAGCGLCQARSPWLFVGCARPGVLPWLFGPGSRRPAASYTAPPLWVFCLLSWRPRCLSTDPLRCGALAAQWPTVPKGLGGAQWVATPLHGGQDQSVSQVQPTLMEEEGMLRAEVSCFSIMASC